MNTRSARRRFVIRRPLAGALAAGALVFSIAATCAHAAPFFGFPAGSHGPGFGVNLPPTTPGVLSPGGSIGPLTFGDSIASADLGHWEVELSNPNLFPMVFDVTFIFPGGPVIGNLTLPPASSAFFDVDYLDTPPEVSPPLWSLSASSDPGMAGFLFVDSDAIEYPAPAGPGVPGLGAPVAGGGPGGGGVVWGLPTGGIGVTLTLEVVPEPSSLTLTGLGVAGLAGRVRRRPKTVA